MACVTVQLGQCGTQVGHQFLNVVYEDAVKESPLVSSSANEHYKNSSLQTFFNERSSGQYEARSVMVDMEPKAVSCALQGTNGKRWRYPDRQQFCQKSGSGNNWSYGFKVHAPRCEEAVAEITRREVEKCDYFGGFMVLSSLAGGTGSGLGSYVTGMLKDAYPHSPIVNPVVCPYTHGEVAVQNYNAILSLAHTCATTNATVLLHNDHFHQICSKLLGIKNVSFRDVNGVIANQLASLLQPVACTSETGSLYRTGSQDCLNEILSSAACHSRYTMLDLKSLPHVAQASVAYSTFSWEALTKRIHQMLITDFYMDEGLDWHKKLNSSKPNTYPNQPRYASNVLIMRGHQALTPTDQKLPEFDNFRLYPSWIPNHSCCPIWKTNVPFLSHEKSVTLLSNGTSCVKPLDAILSKAWQMFGSRAYLHHYHKHGLENDDFVNAFVAVENVLAAYKKL